jgi:metal-responsive CopG/Arc/MetJ family transcriptional regulator
MKRVLVNLPEKIFDIIQKELRGKMGDSNSEVIRSIVVAYLSEKGYMNKEVPT